MLARSIETQVPRIAISKMQQSNCNDFFHLDIATQYHIQHSRLSLTYLLTCSLIDDLVWKSRPALILFPVEIMIYLVKYLGFDIHMKILVSERSSPTKSTKQIHLTSLASPTYD